MFQDTDIVLLCSKYTASLPKPLSKKHSFF